MKPPKGPIFFEPNTVSWCGMTADDAVVASLAVKSESSVRLCRWDARTGGRLSMAVAKEYCERAAIAPAGDRMAAVGASLWLFDADGTLRHKAPAWVKDNVNAARVTFSPDGSLVAAVTEKSSFALPIIVWDATTGQERLRACVAPLIPGERPNIGGRQLAFSPDGASLVVWTDDPRVGAAVAVVVDVASHASRTVGADAPELAWVGRSLDDAVVTSHGWVASRPSLWAAPSITVTDPSGAVRYELTGLGEKLRDHGFSPSGRFVYAVAAGEIHVWDLTTGQRVADPRAK